MSLQVSESEDMRMLLKGSCSQQCKLSKQQLLSDQVRAQRSPSEFSDRKDGLPARLVGFTGMGLLQSSCSDGSSTWFNALLLLS